MREAYIQQHLKEEVESWHLKRMYLRRNPPAQHSLRQRDIKKSIAQMTSFFKLLALCRKNVNRSKFNPDPVL